MAQDKTPPHIKLAERNHVENPRFSHLCRSGGGIISIVQGLLTGKKRVTPLLSESQEVSA